MSGVAVQHATALIESGAADVVALVYGTNARSAKASFGGPGGAYGEAGPTAAYDAMYGMTSPGAYAAMMWRRYAELFGAGEAALVPLAINNRRNAALNPGAVMKGQIDEVEYLQARFVAEPLRLYDYCVINDGAVALILTSVERAASLRQRPVRIAATAAAGDLSNYYSSDDFYFTSCQDVAGRLYEQCGIRPDDVDCLQVYDNFTPVTVFALEGFGHVERGSGWEWIEGDRIAVDGPRPLNTSGGHTGEGYLQGWALQVEAVRQIRGQAGARQVDGCEVAQFMCAAPIVTSHILVGV
jgi:acetyl-CoA acetyltransferase